MEKATIPRDKDKSLRVSAGAWRRLKQRALDDGITVRELMERAVHQYLGPPSITTTSKPDETIIVSGGRGYRVPAAPSEPPEKHWTPDD